MRFEEILRIHNSLSNYLNYEQLISLFTFALDQEEFAAVSADVPMRLDGAIVEMLAGLSVPDFVYKVHGFASLHTVSLEELVSSADCAVQVKLPKNNGSRQEYFRKMISPVYEAIISKHSRLIRDLASKDFPTMLKVIADENLDDSGRRELAVGLMFCGEEWKAMLASLMHKGVCYGNVLLSQYADLLEQSIVLESDNKELRQLKRAVERAKSKRDADLADANAELASARVTISELERKLSEKPEIDLDAETSELVDELIQEYKDENRDLQEQITTLDARHAFALERYKRLRASLKQQYISRRPKEREVAFGGIKVFASSDFMDRYFDVFTYQDADLGDSTFTDVIDGIVNYICERIRDGRKQIINTEFEWMQSVGLHFYKHNKSPGRWTRIFFVSDWASELTVYDIITPAEHQAKVASYGGRYKRIHNGDIDYNRDAGERVMIERTFAELFDDG